VRRTESLVIKIGEVRRTESLVIKILCQNKTEGERGNFWVIELFSKRRLYSGLLTGSHLQLKNCCTHGGMWLGGGVLVRPHWETESKGAGTIF
jgi:hypothetical protein